MNDASTDLRLVADEIRACTACPLHRSARQAVPGDGSADSGIFFLVLGPEDILKFFAFATGTVSTVPAPPGGWGNLAPGFSATRDGRFVLWTRTDNTISDLMLIDPWTP